MKIFFSLVLFVSTLFSASYNFTETRYSDALERSMELKGVINLQSDGLIIKYKNSTKTIKYSDEEVEISEDDELLELDSQEATQLAQYFELVLMLFNADTKTLSTEFEVSQSHNKQTLIPIMQLSNYIEKIELQRENSQLKTLQIFLSNGDNIKISIEDEVR